MRPYDPTAPLPKGLTLLEASAGTGKTYGITNLVLRLVAEEGLSLSQILLVTFTRAATAELRERVRLRLALALAVLEGRAPSDDPVLDALAASPRRELLHKRISDALVDFDVCLISTLHGFCQRMLQDYAFEAGADFDLELVPDSSARIAELVDDHLSRRRHSASSAELAWLDGTVGLSRSALLGLAKAAVDDPDLLLLPDDAPPPASAWEDALVELRRDLGGDLEQQLTQQVADAKATGVLQPRQRTYTPTTLPRLLAELRQWLEARPEVWDPLPGAFDKLSAASLLDKCVPGAALPAALAHHLYRLQAVPRLVDALADHERASFARWAREQFSARNAEARVQSYADLVRGLARAINPSSPGHRALVDAIRGRFRAALIDEFQDTDLTQWALFRGLFHAPTHWLFLIGDPKQAIYGFRGANVQVYLQARQAAGERCYTMARNYRSDGPLVAALNHLMGQAGFFGDGSIEYVAVDTPPREPEARLIPGPDIAPQPLQLRFVDGAAAGAAPATIVSKGASARLLPALVADDVVALLASNTRLIDGEERPLRPSDIAILVRTGTQAQAIEQALLAAGVPAARTGTASVFESPAAAELELWLLALHRPGHEGAARAAATSSLFGQSAHLLQALDDEDEQALRTWEDWLGSLARARELLAQRGFLVALRETMATHQVSERLLAQPGGERLLTDLLHVAELLHTYAVESRAGLDGLLPWLAARRAEGGSDSDAYAIRLERDDDAVCVLTMHKSKGLEYPVVFAPYLWDGRPPDGKGLHLVAPHPTDLCARVLDVRAARSHLSLPRAAAEAQSESLRLLYVALTRARHRCVVYGGFLKDAEKGPLLPALWGAGEARLERALQLLEQGPEALFESLCAGAGASPHVGICRALPPRGLRWSPPAKELPDLAPRAFHRPSLDRSWRRHSYTSMLHGATSAPTVHEGVDVDAHARVEHAEAEGPPVPLADFPAGAQPGIFLHEVLEDTDFAWARTDEGRALLRARLDELLPRHGLAAEEWADALTEQLSAALTTPLGGPMGELALADVSRAHRFDELRFDLPVLGGRSWRAGETPPLPGSAIVEAMGLGGPRPTLQPDYLLRLSALQLSELAGFLTGSIDLVFRTELGGEERWFIADYKSNRLGSTLGAYAPAALCAAMEDHHYPLQAHLYTLALHRLLRWRLPDYDYDRHMGGTYYLFLRGMVGPQARASGCFHDRPPRAVIEALDALFTGPEAP